MESPDKNNFEKEILQTEEKILATEKRILKEERTLLQKLQNRETLKIIGAVLVLIAAVGGGIYWYVTSQRVYTDNAVIEAPLIDLSPDAPGTLRQLFVNEGDSVQANAMVARVGDGLIKTDAMGIVVTVNNEIGKLFSPGEPVVTMINPDDLRVDATIPEDKGFSDVRVGQSVIFTVDAFGSKQYAGVVDAIAKTAKQQSVVFNISDKRQENEFVVKIKFDTSRYPELLNGMSARVWIYK